MRLVQRCIMFRDFASGGSDNPYNFLAEKHIRKWGQNEKEVSGEIERKLFESVNKGENKT